MCCTTTHILARGPAGRFPVASPRAVGAPGGIWPTFAPAKRIAVLSLAGRDFTLLLHLHRPRGCRSPVEPSVKGETLALPSEHPINQDLETCLSTWTDHAQTSGRVIATSGERSCSPRPPMTKAALFPYCQQSSNTQRQLRSCLFPVSGTD